MYGGGFLWRLLEHPAKNLIELSFIRFHVLLFHRTAAKFTVDMTVGFQVICLPTGGKQITLTFTIQSDPEKVREQYRPFLAPLYEALEAALPLAYDIIEHQGWLPTPQLFSHMVRADVKKSLDGKACPIEYDDAIRVLKMDAVSMEGLATTVDGVDFKILKGEELRPAESQAREYFYQHQTADLFTNGKIPELRSLVVLWECGAQGKTLRVSLACPKDASGNWFWCIPIPPPAEWMVVPQQDTPPANGGGDLDISKDEPGEKQV